MVPAINHFSSKFLPIYFTLNYHSTLTYTPFNKRLTELVAPHRETAQAPLCRFVQGLRVQSQALSLSLSVCAKITCPQDTRDTAMYTGSGRCKA